MSSYFKQYLEIAIYSLNLIFRIAINKQLDGSKRLGCKLLNHVWNARHEQSKNLAWRN